MLNTHNFFKNDEEKQKAKDAKCKGHDGNGSVCLLRDSCAKYVEDISKHDNVRDDFPYEHQLGSCRAFKAKD